MTNPPAADALDRKPAAEPWVSVEEVAAYLGVKKLSIYRWIEARNLPARKIGRLWKLKLSHVEAWVQSSSTAAEESPIPDSPPSTPRSGVRAIERPCVQHPKTILVIDDDAATRASVGDLLSSAGYRVLLARDSGEAIEHLATPPEERRGSRAARDS